jgi:hypothetical protein
MTADPISKRYGTVATDYDDVNLARPAQDHAKFIALRLMQE